LCQTSLNNSVQGKTHLSTIHTSYTLAAILMPYHNNSQQTPNITYQDNIEHQKLCIEHYHQANVLDWVVAIIQSSLWQVTYFFIILLKKTPCKSNQLSNNSRFPRLSSLKITKIYILFVSQQKLTSPK